MYLHVFTSAWPPVLATLAVILLSSGLDDLVPTLICLWHWTLGRLSPKRSGADPLVDPAPTRASERRIAIFVPCWKESAVIGNMIRHNVAAIWYQNYDFFLGVYPNDVATLDVARQLASSFRRVHVAACPHPGPTSKADCLNWIYQRMLLHERETGAHFDTIVLHDAEDLVHPEALALINRERERYAMVQVPVLPLPTPLSEFTHGIYCDEFAEYQTVDMRARQICRSFIPSNGVGTGFAREILDRLADERNDLVFNPASLTEDYEAGVYIHTAGYSQTFSPLRKTNGEFCATREFFPRRIKSAIRQRTRWVTGIGLQSWARDGWRGSLRSKYWFWRDRKGMLTNPLSLLTNMLFVAGLADWVQAQLQHRPWSFAVHNPLVLRLCIWTSLLQCVRLSLRMLYSGRIYGLRFAVGVPLRQFHGNFINCFASLGALWQFFDARLHRRSLVWLKTEHAYPGRDSIVPQSRGLADVLVGGAYLPPDVLSRVQTELHSDTFLAEFLLARGILSDDDLCAAVSLQSGVPFTRIDTSRIDCRIPRTLPIHIEQRFGVVPFGIDGGRLFVAGTRVPPPKMYEEVKRLTRLPVEFHLITRRNYEQLRALL